MNMQAEQKIREIIAQIDRERDELALAKVNTMAGVGGEGDNGKSL